jgi:hypothetical protein
MYVLKSKFKNQKYSKSHIYDTNIYTILTY